MSDVNKVIRLEKKHTIYGMEESVTLQTSAYFSHLGLFNLEWEKYFRDSVDGTSFNYRCTVNAVEYRTLTGNQVAAMPACVDTPKRDYVIPVHLHHTTNMRVYDMRYLHKGLIHSGPFVAIIELWDGRYFLAMNNGFKLGQVSLDHNFGSFRRLDEDDQETIGCRHTLSVGDALIQMDNDSNYLFRFCDTLLEPDSAAVRLYVSHACRSLLRYFKAVDELKFSGWEIAPALAQLYINSVLNSNEIEILNDLKTKYVKDRI